MILAFERPKSALDSASSSPDSQSRPSRDEEIEMRERSERRALIVEDETLFAMGLTIDMQALGFANCDVAATGQDAFLKAMEDQPDIVLMDVNLEGGREGIEAARWLREVCDVPIVFVTAYNDRDTVALIHEQVPGAPVIAKTVYRSRLPKAVKEALG
jgi:DNA-binding NarL/FixJ family response regulator